ncbi:MAG: hypothetical protein CMJ34_10970 [Phycisphaerae bacterium]|nr:hypothetical protein [Phycisphaerae bacterium]
MLQSIEVASNRFMAFIPENGSWGRDRGPTRGKDSGWSGSASTVAPMTREADDLGGHLGTEDDVTSG